MSTSSKVSAACFSRLSFSATGLFSIFSCSSPIKASFSLITAVCRRPYFLGPSSCHARPHQQFKTNKMQLIWPRLFLQRCTWKAIFLHLRKSIFLSILHCFITSSWKAKTSHTHWWLVMKKAPVCGSQIFDKLPHLKYQGHPYMFSWKRPKRLHGNTLFFFKQPFYSPRELYSLDCFSALS